MACDLPTVEEEQNQAQKKRRIFESTPEMRARIIELIGDPHDDFERAVVTCVDDVTNLLEFFARRKFMEFSMRGKDVAWLKRAAMISDDGVKGEQWGECPTAYMRLAKLGYVIGKPSKKGFRAVITQTGVEKLIECLHKASEGAANG